jgi:hypothetical protein
LVQEDPDPGRQKLPTKNNEISWSEELDASHLMALKIHHGGPRRRILQFVSKFCEF